MESKEFKKLLANGIKEISEGLSSDMVPIDQKILISLTNLVYKRLVESDRIISDFTPYRETINKILTGNIPFYKLNAINLLSAFASYQNKKPTINTPKEWIQ